MKLEEANLATGSTIDCEIRFLRGGGSEYRAIPVGELKELLEAIKPDYEKWASKEWDGYSASLKIYFEEEDIDPAEKYSRFYKRERHTIATSYVWSKTNLNAMAGCILFVF